MKETNHKVNHMFQPNNSSCGYTALAILLSYYGKNLTPEDLLRNIPQPVFKDGSPAGSITAQLVSWCQQSGFKTKMYTSDLFVMDLSYRDKTAEQIRDRLKEIHGKRDIPLLGEYWAKVYEEAYIKMIDGGADIEVVPFIKQSLLYELLANGPVFANICSTSLRGGGRTVSTDDRKAHQDDLKGNINTHSLVIYGNDEEGNFLVADPWDGLVVIDPETMVLAIEAAQIECDNQVFIIK